MQSTLIRFTSRVVSLAKKATDDPTEPPVKKGDGGYADWVIVAIHGLRELFDHSYRLLMEELSEMDDVFAKLGLEVDEQPDFTTVLSGIKTPIWPSGGRCSATLANFWTPVRCGLSTQPGLIDMGLVSITRRARDIRSKPLKRLLS